MYMRFMQLQIQAQSVEKFKEFYENKIYHRLEKMSGCLFAGLLCSLDNTDFISLTFWKSLTDVENYEMEGAFRGLFDDSKPYLSESTEWKLNLSDDMQLEYKPVNEDPVIKKYAVKAQKEEEVTLSNANMFLRTVSGKVQKTKIKEFKEIYSGTILPELKLVEGCRYVYLIENMVEDDEFVSLTIWDSKEALDKFETGGKYSELIDKIKHTFSQFYLWKMELEKDFNAQIQTTEDLKVESYNLVTGKSFHKKD